MNNDQYLQLIIDLLKHEQLEAPGPDDTSVNQKIYDALLSLQEQRDQAIKELEDMFYWSDGDDEYSEFFI